MELQPIRLDLDYDALYEFVDDLLHIQVGNRTIPLVLLSVGMEFMECDKRLCKAGLKIYVRIATPGEKHDFGRDCEYILVKELTPGVRDRRRVDLSFPEGYKKAW